MIMIWIISLCIIFIKTSVAAGPASSCRYTMKEPKGVITTPNFPNPYPVPISCQWVIEAPTDKVIAVYFTQFYMREGLKATEYAYYSPNVKMGKTEFGTISSEREPTYLVSNKNVLVLDFNVRELANIHMRVREYLLDVFGFNITYEFLSRNESVRKDACLYHHCSFTGKCFATPGYDKYYCSCFSKYFGEECQYDAECGPDASRNMCLNGGTCRYYIGSSVRTCECPPGYDGARCEAKKSATTKQSECLGSSCNRSCSSETIDVNDKNCTQDERRLRYIISLHLTNPKVNSFISERKKMDTFKREMEHALSLLFKGRLEIMENITVLEVRSNAIMKFHMLSKKEDGEEIRSTIEQMLKLGKLGSFDFDHEYQEIYSEPALRIERMEASEIMPVAEGTELTLACMIEGSSSMKVTWFRDGFPVHIHSAERSMWTTMVPKNSQEQYTSLLGFDRVASLDSGTFTCHVTDWGFSQNRSIFVHVLSAPQPQLSPITSTIYSGSSLVITCLSREDLYGTFGYTWLKNGRVLNPSMEPEMAEDLFPAGSRILLQEATASAVYSCIITSSAGSTRKDSIITVIDKDSSKNCCPADDYLKVRWTQSAPNTVNIQLCPTGYTGDVRRKCSLKTSGSGAVWEEPDFSDCFSGGFISLRKKVDSLRLGYLISDAASLLSRLKRYLMSKKPKLHFCEGEPIVDVLKEIINIKHGDKKNHESWPTFLDITSALLESPILIRKQTKLIQLHDLIFNYGFQYADKSNAVSFEMFERKVLAVHVGKVPEDLHQTLKLPSQMFTAANKFSESPALQYAWMTNSVELDFSNIASIETKDNLTASVVAVFYKNLSSHLPQRFFTKKGVVDVEYQLISSLVGVHVNGDLDEEDIDIRISLRNFNHTVALSNDKKTGWNISCAMAKFEHGVVQFTTNHCHLIWRQGNDSICQCHRLGTYALLLTHYAIPEEIHIEVSFDAIAGTGCAICAFLLLITLFLLISIFRKIRGAITALKLQVCVALLGAFGIFLWGLLQPLSEEFFTYTVSLIQFFLLTAFSLQLCMALVVYIENVDIKNTQYSFTKISALGWAIPVIIVGATLAAQSLEEYTLEGWWLTLGSNFFYAYTSSILILTMFQVLLFLIVKTEVKNYRKVADFLQNKKLKIGNSRITLLHRSLFLTSTLLFMSMSSILYVNYQEKIYEYLFALSSILVGLVVCLSYTLCSEKHLKFCCLQDKNEKQMDREDSDMRSGTDSFKSFLKPEIVDDSYSRKMHIDADKRAERIKRMYSQIEKASLSDSLTSHRTDVTSELLNPHQYQHTESEDGHTPIFKPYQHATITSDSPQLFSKDRDPFCDSLEKEDGYPKMHWRYANHPHIMLGSPGGALSKHSRDHTGPTSAKRPLLLETEVDNTKLSDSQKVDYETGDHYSNFSSGASFLPSQIVKADISGQCNTIDGLDDGNSLKNSCFLQHTDSLETVVHCDTTKKNEAPLRTITRDLTIPTQSWNMTTV